MKTDIGPGSRTPTIARERRFWDWHWENWRDQKTVNEWMHQRGERVLSLVSSLGLDRPKILDLGCGIGWFSQELSRIGEVTGIDLSEEAIAQAKARYPHLSFLAGDVLSTPLPPEHFDIVVSLEAFAHVGDQSRFLQVAANTLRRGGYLILTTVNKFVVDRSGTPIWDPQTPEHIEKFLDMKGLKRLLARHFRVLRTTSFLPIGDAGILRLVNSPRLNRALSLLIPERSLQALKERVGLGYTLIALAQKRS